jgi:hypothetical protein
VKKNTFDTLVLIVKYDLNFAMLRPGFLPLNAEEAVSGIVKCNLLLAS